MEDLSYDGGLSKYAVVKSLFPDDSYTHRMKRLQRAARKRVWEKHFDFYVVKKQHYKGFYTVTQLVFPNGRFDGYVFIHPDHIQFLKADLLFDHEPRLNDESFWSYISKLLSYVGTKVNDII